MKKQFFARQLFIAFCDVVILLLSSFLSLWVRFEFSFETLKESGYFMGVLELMPLSAAIMVTIFALFGLYRSLWQFAGESEVVKSIIAGSIAVGLQNGIHYILNRPVPRSFVFMNAILFTIMVLVLRLSYRFLRHMRNSQRNYTGKNRRTMIIGAGDSGAMIVRELQRSTHSESTVVCFVDDDPAKVGRLLYGIPVEGNTSRIVDIVLKYQVEDIIFAIPTATGEQKRKILGECQKTGCALKTLPGIYQLVNGEVDIQKIRKVEIEDLLARDSIKVSIDDIVGYLNDRVVLVTGGGGSIGSELCRQIADHGPKKLIIFDIYENSAYAIEQELKRKNPYLDLTVLIGSVRDTKRIEAVFEEYHPDIVYHAAAHKHVPLMETSPCESIKNNVFGTWNVANTAGKYGTGTFILISTDKAVNPTNIMGASKRLCEMVISDMAKKYDTKYSCVRFGNVLGSNGSVIPLFKKQIEQGGPVTVTHKDIIRYFMTIPEAVSLVLQAGAYAKDSEIFVLDMGEPVKIDDLARNMIRLSGFEPDVDIAIKYTGLRPGEKLFEELLMSEEGLRKTPNDLIFIGQLEDIDSASFEASLEELKFACENNSSDIRDMVQRLVPTYTPKK